MSSSETLNRPSSAASALPASARYWQARGPAPHFTYFSTNSSFSGEPGRLARTSRTANFATDSGTGIQRIAFWNAINSAAVIAFSGFCCAEPVVSHITRSSESKSG